MLGFVTQGAAEGDDGTAVEVARSTMDAVKQHFSDNKDRYILFGGIILLSVFVMLLWMVIEHHNKIKEQEEEINELQSNHPDSEPESFTDAESINSETAEETSIRKQLFNGNPSAAYSQHNFTANQVYTMMPRGASYGRKKK